ncbi:ribosomal protection-like ABC-F family protein [Paenibacillus sp. 1P07SE]|uniref:ribosomal protection-like ABC-F family protein n=1 Tax=Paenibacillus sp. 1P07SE TaxID=3132209 RepID=UPI0039A48BF7
MMRLIKAKDIYVEYMGRAVLDVEELELYAYDRIGLVGANGAGKSTLVKVLLGEQRPLEGEVVREGVLAYIPQLEDAPAAGDIEDYALRGKLGLAAGELDRPSGGEETRLKIAQALASAADGIVADEPTSHLDREGTELLIGQLKHYSGALLIISHDRHFLDQTVDKIWELKDGRITEYWGGYSDYLTRKEEERTAQAAQYKQVAAERERLEKAIAEKQAQARKMEQKERGAARKNSSDSGGRLSHQKTVGSKQKKMHKAAKQMEHRIEALGTVELPEAERKVTFRQSKALELHNPFPVTGTEINKRYGDKVIFDKASFQFPLGAKIAITGGNGTGKTTLLRMIAEREAGITLAPKAEIGYFDQKGYKTGGDQQVMAYMQELSDYQVPEIRAVLASMGFTAQDVRKRLSMLSGGERMKLQLARLLLGRYNILLLDEPGNFLDLPAIEALETLMQDYNGTIIFISHDQRLLQHTADLIYEIRDGKLVQTEL